MTGRRFRRPGPPAWWALVGVLLVAFNLRGPIVAVAPVLGSIRADTGISSAIEGLLTSIPVICFGVCAPLAPRVARRVGIEATLAGAMALLAAGIVLRLAVPLAALFAGTVLVGAAIACGNVLLPALVKRDFGHRPGPVTSLYVTALSIGALVAAGATVPFRDAAAVSWRVALVVWAVPAVVAATWLRARRSPAPDPSVAAPPPPVEAMRRLRRDPLAWQVTGYMALQSFGFYATTSWLPSLFVDHGVSPTGAGVLLAVASLASIPSSLGVPVLAARSRTQHHLMAATATLWLAALAGLLVAPTGAAPLWMVLLGLAQGSSLGLALSLIVLRSPSSEHAARLSSMAQGVGYLVAGAGPLTIGALHDATGGWTAPLTLLAVLLAPQLAVGLGASRDRHVGLTAARAR